MRPVRPPIVANVPPPGPLGSRREPFVRRHATGITVALFLGGGLALGTAPVPDELKPVELSTPDDVLGVATRVFRKPRMTLASLEAPPPADTDEPEEEVAEADEGALEEAAASDGGPLPEGAPEALLTATLDTERRLEEPPEAASTGRERDRRERPVTERALYLRKLARALEAPGAAIDNPCVAHDERGCLRTALDPFFVSLDAVDDKERGSHATVVTLGNSLIASDHVTDIVRKRLVERFGGGGRGFLLPDRLSKVAGRRVRTGRGTSGWEIHTFAQKPPKRDVFGFTGSAHESTQKGDRVRWSLKGAVRARLFYLDHEGAAPFELDTDGKRLARVEPSAHDGPKDRILDLELPSGATTLSLTAEGPGVVLYGVALAKDKPGVVWDTIGVPASDASMYVGTDEGVFTRQLQAREPSLVVAMIGGNEIRSLSYGWTTLDEVRAQYGALLDRIKKAVPDAACLAVSPIDAAKATAAGAELTTRRETLDVVEMERQVAREKGCAFFDLFGAMGGEGALGRFHQKGLVHDDLVHPKGKGGDVLGQLFADALLASYRETPSPRAELKARRRLVRPKLYALSFPQKEGAPPPLPGEPGSRPLRGWFEKLRALERGESVRVAVGQFGASHTAGQVMTDRVRERLADRFGHAGRGYVAVGPSDAALLPSRVTRKLSGPFEVADGRHVMLGGAVSMNGTKARLLPGARFDMAFCDGCREARYRAPGFLELAWLYTPDMGAADVFVNDVHVGVLSPNERRHESDVQLLRIPVRGEAHTLSVVVRDEDDDKRRRRDDEEEDIPPGPVNLFSVAAEVSRPGVVIDAVGLPGSTGMTMQRWRRDLIKEQVAARDYDLVVTAWGTNESGLKDLDAVTYRHHFKETLRTLLEAAPGADCVVVGPTDRQLKRKGQWQPAPRYDLVVSVQQEVAAELGCAYFETRKAMGGRGSMGWWLKEGLASEDRVHLTKKGYRRLADLLLHDLLAMYAYDRALDEEEREKRRGVEVAKTPPPPGPDASPKKTGRSG